MLVEIVEADRGLLVPLFAAYQYDRVITDTVLEGSFGDAWADSADRPRVARLDASSFTVLGGDPLAPAARALLHRSPIFYVTPQTGEWRRLLEAEFGPHLFALRFTRFIAACLDLARLAGLAESLPSEYRVRRLDRELVKRLPLETGNDQFLEIFTSVDDFLGRGLGYCVLFQNRIVSAATSMARSSRGIDIEIQTVPAFRRRGLGTAVASALLQSCLRQGLTPHWLAANPESEALARKLGFSRGDSYETLAVQSAGTP